MGVRLRFRIGPLAFSAPLTRTAAQRRAAGRRQQMRREEKRRRDGKPLKLDGYR
jgi:hypothetical protein